MKRQVRGPVFHELKDARVRDDQSVRVHLAHSVDIFFELGHIFIVRKQIKREIGAFTVCMAEINPLYHLFQRELAFGAQTQVRRAKIDCIGSVEHSHFQFAQVARRHKKFGTMGHCGLEMG